MGLIYVFSKSRAFSPTDHSKESQRCSRHKKNPCTTADSRTEEPRVRTSWAARVVSSPWPTAAKRMGTSGLHSREARCCQQPRELEADSSPNLPEKRPVWLKVDTGFV